MSAQARKAQAAQDYEVRAGLEHIPVFAVVGVSAMISGAEKAAEEINALWQVFFEQQVGQRIENRDGESIYAVYSDYAGDHTKPYRLTIGYKVDGPVQATAFHAVQVEEADYAMMGAAGEQPKALMETWQAVWQSDLDRKFGTDFEVYGPRFFEEGVNEVLVCIGVNL